MTEPAHGGAWLSIVVGGWLVFLGVLGAGLLDDVWSAVRDLPLAAELAVWLLALPWMLGAAVWESSWAGWLRALVVFALAAGWILVAIPRGPEGAPNVSHNSHG